MANVSLTMESDSWDSLRKEARLLENEIDAKLVALSKVGTNFNQNFRSYSRTPDKEPLLDSSEEVFETRTREMEELLGRLTNVNDALARFMDNHAFENGAATKSAGASMLHILQRHRDILQDYSHEFQKTKSNILALREREELLGSVKKDIDAFNKQGSTALNRRSELYMKETDHLRNSERLIDDQIAIAMATKENLTQQRGAFHSISQRLVNTLHKFPLINSLVQRINLRKRRDSIILASVIAICLILLILYSLRS